MIVFRTLFLALIGISMLYFMVLTRRSATKRLFLAIFFGTGAIFVLWPNLTNRIAWALGIGRGADLIFYVSIVFLFFLLFNMYLQFSGLETRQSRLVRELAMLRPLQLPEGSSTAQDQREQGPRPAPIERR